MKFCTHCGKEVNEQAVICVNCGCSLTENGGKERIENDHNNLARFLLTFFLGWIGSFIINHTSLKPVGFRCRTLAYFFLSMLTCGIYALVASICNFSFDANKPSNIGYVKE